MRGLRRHTILERLPCELKTLPLTAFEGFLLTLIDGQSTLGDIAEDNGMTLAQIFPPADRLVEVGAVGVVGEKGAPREVPRKSTPPRRDSKALASARPTKAPPPRSQPTKAPPPRSQPTRPPPVRRASHASRPPPRPPERRATPAATPPGKAAGPPLDEAVAARILGFHARLGEVDHYAALAVPRGAEKAVIKRAYFALAAEFHPDRHFGKDLGKAGPALQRIFTRLTEAHDTLVNRSRRAEYDARLPPIAAEQTPSALVPPAPAPPPPPEPAPAPPRRTSSRALAAQRAPTRRSTRKMRSVEAPPVAPAAPPPEKPASVRPAPRPAEPAQPVAAPPPSLAAPPAAARRSQQAEEAMRRLYAGAKLEEVRRRAGVFTAAAEDAMRRDDVVTAASHYRFALQNNDDPILRAKLDAIEGTSKERTYERSLSKARSAERGERWADAAAYFVQAHTTRPEAGTADRAAHALRMSGGDLRRAAQLAEEAVLAEPKNAAFRVTLGQVCLAANLVKRAAGEAERALAINPDDASAKALAAAAAKKR